MGLATFNVIFYITLSYNNVQLSVEFWIVGPPSFMSANCWHRKIFPIYKLHVLELPSSWLNLLLTWSLLAWSNLYLVACMTQLSQLRAMVWSWYETSRSNEFAFWYWKAHIPMILKLKRTSIIISIPWSICFKNLAPPFRAWGPHTTLAGFKDIEAQALWLKWFRSGRGRFDKRWGQYYCIFRFKGIVDRWHSGPENLAAAAQFQSF